MTATNVTSPRQMTSPWCHLLYWSDTSVHPHKNVQFEATHRTSSCLENGTHKQLVRVWNVLSHFKRARHGCETRCSSGNAHLGLALDDPLATDHRPPIKRQRPRPHIYRRDKQDSMGKQDIWPEVGRAPHLGLHSKLHVKHFFQHVWDFSRILSVNIPLH